ncbi:ABC transporter permease [Agrobacterium pusense]|uniref:ABC transporter permease n=1 Tax=Agrobacterium pusense TaxID=648995 RepID=A0AA44EGI3_9HYPH|nr:ABC transporter permease [Agrobacterium pusense]MDH0873187.1 ABC transporter permease [Agrobacterium pusense]NRF07241.1 ABC transporter permease [Agrobacterium pusense]NRF17795.1 ABC transporter permease [Agrobacterium pusense]PZU77863.1 MAG: ABC transporter permease [Rhizobium sp.]
MDLAFFTDFLSSSLRLSIPLVFAAIGVVWAERSGVFNIAIEGCILGGAFGAAIGTWWFGDPLGGLLMALVVASLLGLLLGGLAVGLGINQLVAGIAINLLVSGMTAYLARQIMGASATSPLPGFNIWQIPFLSDIPLVGPVLFNQGPLAYLAYITVPLAWWLLYRTPWGLLLRAAGNQPMAVDTAGVDVQRLRYVSVIGSCMLGGLGGAYIVLSQVHVFTENMSAGKGFIALGAVILGRWNPLGAAIACLAFGMADATQLRLQFGSPEIPYQLFSTLPFIAALLALVLLSGKVHAPAAVGKKFERSGK